jgi:hypothetical protein
LGNSPQIASLILAWRILYVAAEFETSMALEVRGFQAVLTNVSPSIPHVSQESMMMVQQCDDEDRRDDEGAYRSLGVLE